MLGNPEVDPETGLWEITEDVPELDFQGSLQGFAGCVNQIVLHYTTHPQGRCGIKPGLLLSRLITAEGGFVDFILHYD
jgi:hypothetical protein